MQNVSRRQRGVSLIEGLAAMLVLSIGVLAFARIQSELRLNADIARQRTEAVRIAQEDLESLRAFTVLGASGGQTSYDGSIANLGSTSVTTLSNLNTTFHISRVASISAAPSYKSLVVNVEWLDRQGASQQVRLHSAIARVDPSLSGLSAIPRASSGGAKNPKDRHPAIPIDAVDLGNRESGFRVPGHDRAFWVFNSDTGMIKKICTLSSGSTTLDAASYASAACTPQDGYLLSGHIRFDLSNSPSSKAPGSNACHFYTDITSASNCSSIASPLNLLDVTVSGGAGYTSSECYDDFASAVTGSRGYVNYYCAIYVANSNSSWSGTSSLINGSSTAWSYGTTSAAKTFKNCRYTADYNGNNNIENWEHPQTYASVNTALSGQNFVLIKAGESCPNENAQSSKVGNTTVYVNYRTCLHQPTPSSVASVTSCDI